MASDEQEAAIKADETLLNICQAMALRIDTLDRAMGDANDAILKHERRILELEKWRTSLTENQGGDS